MIQETIEYKRSYETTSEVMWSDLEKVKNFSDVKSLIFTGCKSEREMERIINNYVVLMNRLEVIDLRESCINLKIAHILFNIKINGIQLGKKIIIVFSNTEERSKYVEYLRSDDNAFSIEEVCNFIEYIKHMNFSIVDECFEMESLVRMCKILKVNEIDGRHIDNIMIGDLNDKVLEVMNKYNLIRRFNSVDELLETCPDKLYKLFISVSLDVSNDVFNFISDKYASSVTTEEDMKKIIEHLKNSKSLNAIYLTSQDKIHNIFFKDLFSIFKTTAKRLYINNMNISIMPLIVSIRSNISSEFSNHLLELRIFNSSISFDKNWRIGVYMDIVIFPFNNLKILEMKNVVFDESRDASGVSITTPLSLKRIVFDNCMLKIRFLFKYLENLKVSMMSKDLSCKRKNEVRFSSCKNVHLFCVNEYLRVDLWTSEIKLNVNFCDLSLSIQCNSTVVMSGSLEKFRQLGIHRGGKCTVENVNNAKFKVVELWMENYNFNIGPFDILNYIYLLKNSKVFIHGAKNLFKLYKILTQKKILTNEVKEFDQLDFLMEVKNSNIWDILSMTFFLSSSLLENINTNIIITKELKLSKIPIASMEPVYSIVGPDCNVTFDSINTVGCWFLRSLHRLVAKSFSVKGPDNFIHIFYDYPFLCRSKCKVLQLPNVNNEVVMQILPKSPFNSIYNNRGVNLIQQFARATDRRMRLNNPLYESFFLDAEEDEDMSDEDMSDESDSVDDMVE